MSNEADRILGGRLRKIRVKSGLTQYEVAQRLNEPQAYVSAVENGKTRLRLTDSIIYARCIGIRPYTIFREAMHAVDEGAWLKNNSKALHGTRHSRKKHHHQNTPPQDEAFQ